jgi:hypothetical protein
MALEVPPLELLMSSKTAYTSSSAKQSQHLSMHTGLQLPSSIFNLDFGKIIHQSNNIVNINNTHNTQNIRYAVDNTISNINYDINLSTLDDEELKVYNKKRGVN